MKKISQLFENKEIITEGKDISAVKGYRDNHGKKQRVNILAMGDVGSTLALAMKLTGGDIVEMIGICDVNDNVVARFESEFNQITMPTGYDVFPEAVPVSTEDVFDCDVFVFCASKGVPPVGDSSVDVRMIQLEKNIKMVEDYAAAAVKAGYDGEFFIVSDPVDPLCKGALLGGIRSERIQGFGLGVMNGRAAYYAKKDPELAVYLSEGRAFGPHGEDLVIADSIYNYNDRASKKLTELTVNSNMKTRELGFKPYIAPAVSSGALSILENLRGRWHYSSAYFGAGTEGAFLGMKNRRSEYGLEIEDLPLDEKLYDRIAAAYNNLKETI
ncbi:MAG: lactate dehydrogenase [Eubacteriaceae bacterium]|nr:lactate dehydrogenase [Eubacteriaceae bacterium]